MNEIIPIFYDHSSQKSLIVSWKESECKENGPKSLISICKDANLDKCIIISNNFFTFIENWKNLKAEKIQFVFGLEILICDNVNIHDESSLKNEHKVILMLKNSQAYFDAIKLFSHIQTDINNKYYLFRCDWQILNQFLTNNLILCLPFFSSFIARNLLVYGAAIVPSFAAKPVIWREQDSGIANEQLINKALDSYNTDKQYEEVKTKTIFYNKDNFKSYMIYRSTFERGSFSNPQIDNFCSNKFSIENYKELSK